MPPLPYACSVCSCKLIKHVFRGLVDGDRLVCRFCELKGRMDEVLSAFQDLQRRDVDGEDGGPAAKVFVLEHQLRFVIGEFDRRTALILEEEMGRLREYGNDFDRRLERFVGEVRVELVKVQEELVSTKEDLQVFASTPSKNLRSDMEKASKGLCGYSEETPESKRPCYPRPAAG